MPFYQSLAVMERYLHDSGLVGIWPSTVTELAPFVVTRSIREVLVHDKYMKIMWVDFLSHHGLQTLNLQWSPLVQGIQVWYTVYIYIRICIHSNPIPIIYLDILDSRLPLGPILFFLEEVKLSVASSQSGICISLSRRFGIGRNSMGCHIGHHEAMEGFVKAPSRTGNYLYHLYPSFD